MGAAGEIIWRDGKRPLRKSYAANYKGKPLGNLWTDIPNVTSGAERTGYPTQKPLALLERIIAASSDPGDIVLDPFCGCATTCVAAEKLDRQWVGIDISEMAAKLVKSRLRDELGLFYRGAHRTDIPRRTDLPTDIRPPREHKHHLYGVQEGDCTGCRVHFPIRNLTIDHIHPRSKGGQDNLENLQLLCGACNSAKGDGTQAELVAHLIRTGVKEGA